MVINQVVYVTPVFLCVKAVFHLQWGFVFMYLHTCMCTLYAKVHNIVVVLANVYLPVCFVSLTLQVYTTHTHINKHRPLKAIIASSTLFCG